MRSEFRFALVPGLLALAALACQTIVGTENPAQSDVAQPDVAQSDSIIATDAPTAPEMTPELRNSGINFYSVTVTEGDCPLSLSVPEQDKQIEFIGDQARIWNNNNDSISSYDQVGPHSYLRINDAGKPILVTFSMEGYVLEVYNEGEDPDAVSPCGYFVFTLVD